MGLSSSSSSCFDNHSVNLALKYGAYSIWTIALLMSTIASIILLFILKRIKFQNSYNLLVYMMTVTSLVFDISTIFFTLVIYDLRGLYDLLLALDVIRKVFHIIFYFVSALLSYTSYRLLVHKRSIDDSWRTDSSFRVFFVGVCMIPLISIGVYLGVTVNEQVSAKNKVASFESPLGNFAYVLILFIFSLYSFFTYFYCNYAAKGLFLVRKDANTAELTKAQNIVNTLRHIQWYPFVQGLAVIPKEVLAFACNDYTILKYLDYKPFPFALKVIFDVFFYLNSFLMVCIYVRMNPKSNFVLKAKAFICCNFDEHFEDVKDATSQNSNTGEDRYGVGGGGGGDAFIPSEYRPDSSNEMINRSVNSVESSNPMCDDDDVNERRKSYTSV